MINAEIWRDVYYTTSAETLDYAVFCGFEEIFYGRAVKSPSENLIYVNVSKLCRDWLDAGYLDFSSGETFNYGMNYLEFTLRSVTRDGNGYQYNDLETYGFLLNFDYDGNWSGQSMVMSNPINGRMDSRMFLTFSVFEDTTGRTICREETFIKKLRIIPPYFEVGNSGVTRTIEVIANYDYTVTNTTDWLHISPLSGSSGSTRFTVTVDENGLAEDREGYIYFDESVLTIKQTDAPSYVIVTPTLFDVAYSSSTNTFTVSANCNYEISTDVPWITLYAQSGSSGFTEFTFTVNDNDGGARNGHIFVSGGDAITVNQATWFIPYLNVEPSGLVFYKESGSLIITVTANTGYTVSTDSPWITLSQNYVESGITVITVSVPDYDTTTKRNGTITIGDRVIDVVQYGISTSDYFTIEALEDGNVRLWGNVQNPDPYYYSINGGEWINPEGGHFEVKSGDLIRVKGTKGGRCNCSGCTPECKPPYESDDVSHLVMGMGTEFPFNYYYTDIRYNVYGNVLSLKYGDAFTGITGNDDDIELAYAFYETAVVDASGLILPEKRFSAGHMFHNCYSLRYPPEIPSKPGDLKYMFYSSGLINADIKIEPVNNDYRFDGMFAKCYNLVTIPEITLYDVPVSGCIAMFSECRSIEYVTGLTVTGNVGGYGLSSMFYGCTSLNSVNDLDFVDIGVGGCSRMFEGCSSILTVPNMPNVRNLGDNALNGMFTDCTSLTASTVPSASTISLQTFAYMFSGCTNITQVPDVLPWTTLGGACYEGMFYGCEKITKTPNLPATSLENSCYLLMFANCSSLVTTTTLPATILKAGCYNSMFSGCTSLTSAPDLPAPKLVNRCYAGMFRNCTSLTWIKCLATSNIDPTWSTIDWVKGIPLPSEIGVVGRFIKASSASWDRGDGGIPYGWTVGNA